MLNHRSEITVGVGNERTERTGLESTHQPALSLPPKALALDNTHCSGACYHSPQFLQSVVTSWLSQWLRVRAETRMTSPHCFLPVTRKSPSPRPLSKGHGPGKGAQQGRQPVTALKHPGLNRKVTDSLQVPYNITEPHKSQSNESIVTNLLQEING